MWIWIVLIIVAVLAVGLVIGSGFYAFHFILGKPKRSKDVPESYKNSPHYKVSRAGMKIMDQLPVEDVYLTSRDGLKLHAYLYPAESGNKKFVLGIHGYRSYARPEYGPYIDFYRKAGYSMLLPDDRAHRPSEGEYIGFGVLDRLDCVDWAKYLVSRFGEDTEILLHGVSMGSATVLAASGEEDLPKQVKGIVADCGYTSAWEILSYEIKHMAHLPVRPMLPLCEKICRHRAGFDFHEHTPIEQVRKAKVPILFVHGAKDQMVPVEMAHRLYEACPSKKKLLIVEEAAHAESIAFAPEAYHGAIKELFGI